MPSNGAYASVPHKCFYDEGKNCHTVVFCNAYLYFGFIQITFDWPMTLVYTSSTMRRSFFSLRQAAHVMRPVLRHIPSSALSSSPFVFGRHHTEARSAVSFLNFYHSTPPVTFLVSFRSHLLNFSFGLNACLSTLLQQCCFIAFMK